MTSGRLTSSRSCWLSSARVASPDGDPAAPPAHQTVSIGMRIFNCDSQWNWKLLFFFSLSYHLNAGYQNCCRAVCPLSCAGLRREITPIRPACDSALSAFHIRRLPFPIAYQALYLPTVCLRVTPMSSF
jgi:hypothetical protein